MLHHLLRRPLEADSDRPILECNGSWTTAAELERLAARLASGLAAIGVEEEDRVAILLPNGLEAVVCYLACFRMRLVIVPLDYQYHPLQISYAIGHSGAAILIASHERMPGLDEAGVLKAVPRVVVVGGQPTMARERPFETLLGAERPLPSEPPHDDAPAVMIYTSGTTSRPKGVVLSHGALSTGIRKYLARVTLTADDVALIATSVSRPLALRCQVLPSLWVGGRVSLLPKFTVDTFIAALRQPPAKTFLTLTPAGLGQLMASPDFHGCDFSQLRLCLAGGDRVPGKLLESFERLTGVGITEQCGSTETGPYAMNPPFGRKKPGSVGPPVHGVQVAVVDEQGADVPTGVVGELRVSGPGIMDGYWNESAQTRKALQKGWVLTGDLGRYDEDGYLWFMGRRKDIIVRAGKKVAPLEVEAALSDHPAVREACVIGVPDAASGEVPHAYVILQPGVAASPEDLRDSVASRLAAFMVPAEVHFIAEMPSKGPGKVDRELLRMRAIAAALIEQVPFFKNASSDFLRNIIPRLESREFAAGETIVHEGDVGDEMFFLTKGQVEVLRGDPAERLTVLREGSFFGELAILRDAPRAATIRALTEVEVYALRRDSVRQLADAHADFSRYLQAAALQYGTTADTDGQRIARPMALPQASPD
ncbi:MAG: AMP-binding protein [Planctomycetota bacterium]|nr:AMP-binding protein [Planctomycetota bacterium]